MSNALHLREATLEDVPLILWFIRELAAYEKREVTATEDQLRATLFGERPFAHCLLAFEGDEPAGFAVYYYGYSTFVAKPTFYVEDVFVSAELRGRGIGRQLFLKMLSLAMEKNCGRVEWSVLDWNTSAIDFYRKLGAWEMSEWQKYRLMDHEIGHALDLLKRLANQGSS